MNMCASSSGHPHLEQLLLSMLNLAALVLVKIALCARSQARQAFLGSMFLCQSS